MTTLPLDQRFADAMGQLLGPHFPSDIGLAVSGGGDSMAMLYLAHNWTRQYGVRLWVVTVDHGLRSESAAEALLVAEECAALGWPHTILRWHWDGQGNVQDAARQARLNLIDRWRGDVSHVLFAHTQDDQAETVLMRLARGSGVDGLAGMAPRREVALHPLGIAAIPEESVDGAMPLQRARTPTFEVLRPCLDMSREDLRHYARVLQGRWVEDPSNQDRRYDRVRVRDLLKLLHQEGITAPDLAKTAARMARAQSGLNARLVDALDQCCRDAPLGQVLIGRDAFATFDEETQLRLLTSSLCYVASAEYRPRAASSDALLERVLSGSGGTLHGAEVIVEKAKIRVMRELAAVQDEVSCVGELWDGQWCFAAVDATEFQVKALGQEGWEQISSKVLPDVTYKSALPLPALWSHHDVISTPAADGMLSTNATRYVLGRIDTGFRAFCLSH